MKMTAMASFRWRRLRQNSRRHNPRLPVGSIKYGFRGNMYDETMAWHEKLTTFIKTIICLFILP